VGRLYLLTNKTKSIYADKICKRYSKRTELRGAEQLSEIKERDCRI